MKTNLRQIHGNWDEGWVLDKHIVRSNYLGDNEYGRPQFDTIRTEVGESLYQLKYKYDFSLVSTLATAIVSDIYPKLENVGLIVPMPASNARARQPVTEIAREIGAMTQKPVFNDILLKNPTGVSLKDLHTKEEKINAIKGSLYLNDGIQNDGKWNVLIVDDIYDSGATMETACSILKSYKKVGAIYVAALTWK